MERKGIGVEMNGLTLRSQRHLERMISRWLINRLKSVDYQAAFDELKEAVEAAIGNTLFGDPEPASSRKHCGKSVSISTL